MKKILSIISLAALTIGLWGSCTKEDPKISVSRVTLDKPSLEITVGDPDVILTATVAPDNATDKTVSWSSDKAEVATVDNEGNVHAVAEGTATITVTTTDGGKTATCAVTVKAAVVPVSDVALDKTELTLTVGDPDVILTATVAPDNATDKTVSWSSDKAEVATVDNEGNVHAVAEGTATITVTTTDGGKTATCAVTVVLPVNKVTKIADYLYEYTAEGYSTDAPSELLFDDGSVPIFGCSAVRNGNFYGRNLDLDISETCEFVVRTEATETRPHASIGVANTCFLNITNDMVKDGLSDNLLKYIPWMTMDGINDAGLVCNVNVVNAADIKENPHKHTNEGATQIMVMQLIRALLDNCGSVAEAKTFIKNHDIRPIPTTWDGHIMVADPEETMIVEFTGEKGNEVKFVVQEQMIMTNFYNHLFKEEDFLRTRSINNFPAHACGMERYFILSKNYATANSMQGMWELLKSVRYTQAYDTSVDPFWCSEYYDTPKIPTFDDYPMSYWTKEKVLAQEEPKKEVEAYKTYAATGEYNEEDGLWFTSHNSTYDIANKALWVTIREKYESIYKFEF